MSPSLPRNGAFLKAEVVASPQALQSVVFKCPLNTPPSLPGALGTRAQFKPPVPMTKLALTGIWTSVGHQGPSLETRNCRTGRMMELLGSYPLNDAGK